MRAELAHTVHKDSTCFHLRMLKLHVCVQSDSMSGKALLLQELVRADSGILYSVPVPILSDFLSARQWCLQVAGQCSASREQNSLRVVWVWKAGAHRLPFYSAVVELLVKGKLGSHNSSNQRGERTYQESFLASGSKQIIGNTFEVDMPVFCFAFQNRKEAQVPQKRK